MEARIVTAAELDQMTPQERHANFEASIITDPSKVPPQFVARVRARIEQRIAAQDVADAS